MNWHYFAAFDSASLELALFDINSGQYPVILPYFYLYGQEVFEAIIYMLQQFYGDFLHMSALYPCTGNINVVYHVEIDFDWKKWNTSIDDFVTFNNDAITFYCSAKDSLKCTVCSNLSVLFGNKIWPRVLQLIVLYSSLRFMYRFTWPRISVSK